MALNRTLIDWVKNPDGTEGYTWNPITGCLNHGNGFCKGGGFPCYAYRLANGRLKERYKANTNIATVYAEHGEPYHKADKAIATIDPFYPRFWPERLKQIPEAMKFNKWGYPIDGRGIFVCDMGELFGDWIPHDWQAEIFDVILNNPWHRFYLLTKQPQNLPAWSPFPDNCWVGVTATTEVMYLRACKELHDIEAKVKYISFEPLLEGLHKGGGILTHAGINWLIIGAWTGSLPDFQNSNLALRQGLKLRRWGKKWTAQPQIEWVQEIVQAADKAGIPPVFLKDNLKPLFKNNEPGWMVGWNNKPGELRQEIPK